MNAITHIEQVAGRSMEFTIRGDRNFTFSFEGRDDAAVSKVVEFFAAWANVSADYDEECDQTCIFIEA